jgi:hypothetical protein
MSISIRTPDGVGVVSGDFGSTVSADPGIRTTFGDSRVIGVLVAAVALAIAFIAIPNWPAGVSLRTIIARYHPAYVIGTTTYAVMSARTLSMRTPRELRVHALLPTAAIFALVTPPVAP